MSYASKSLYSAYGAYELKAKYQRNLGLATMIVTSAVITAVGIIWLVSATSANGQTDDIPPETRVIIRRDIPPSPHIVRDLGQTRIPPRPTDIPDVGRLMAVPDDEFFDDEEIVIASRDKLVGDGDDGDPALGHTDFQGSGLSEGFWPSPEKFQILEIEPRMIYRETPKYPRIPKMAGITGIVWIKALINADGKVVRVLVVKERSTSVEAFHEEAVKAAYQNKFSPGIQSSRPIAVWVTYKVEFRLED